MTPSTFVQQRREVISWLVAHDYPALPVAPAQDAQKHPAKDKDGNIKTDGNGNPLPAFTGKNPSYLDKSGTPYLVNHRQYQSKLPTQADRRKWFINPLTGVGTLGGWNDTAWIDFDIKHFDSGDGFRGFLDVWLDHIYKHQPELRNSYTEQTHSGGHRIAVIVKDTSAWRDGDRWRTNFKLKPDGDHCGEVLWAGRFTVLAPTVGSSGQPYLNINRAVPVEIESLESIGIYPVSAAKPDQPRFERPQQQSSTPGAIPLEMLGKDDTRETLNGAHNGDRSAALTAAMKEWYGWENWCHANGVAFRDSAEELASWAGNALELDEDRIARVVRSVDATTCLPACVHKGGDESAWMKVRRLAPKAWKERFSEERDTGSGNDREPKLKPGGKGKREEGRGKEGKGQSSKSDEDNGQPVHKLKADYNAIREVIGDQLRFNTLKNVVEMNGVPLEVETAKQELVIEQDLWLKSGKEEVADLVVKAAKLDSYNPIEDYLNSCHKLHGDDTSILFRFAERYFGQTDPIYTIFAIRFLVGAVARIFEPGCKFDTALILQGGQGIRKSTFFKVLSSPEWFDDSLGNASDKDEKMKLHQTWFMEWAELETVFKRKDISSTKAFLSSATDRLRLPYGRSVIEMPRRCVIVGTTNQDEFLNDVTGNRRFWVIPVKLPVIDTSTLAEERDRLWAAAVALYRHGEFWHLTQCEDQAAAGATEDYQSEDAWNQPIEQWLKQSTLEITTANLLNHALKLEISRQDKAAQMRVSDIMRSLGWEKTRRRVNGENLRLWQPSKEAVPTSFEVGTEVGTVIDLSESSLYQYFQRSNNSNVPTVPTVPTSNKDHCFFGNGSADESDQKISLEKSPLGDHVDKVDKVGTVQPRQGFQRSIQVGTVGGGRLEHLPAISDEPVLNVGDRVMDARNGKTGVITAFDGDVCEIDSDQLGGWINRSHLRRC